MKRAKIIVCDPRQLETARIADQHLQLKNGSQYGTGAPFWLCAAAEERLYDKKLRHTRFTEGLEAYRRPMKSTRQRRSNIDPACPHDVPPGDAHFRGPFRDRDVGMGVTQFGQAVDVVKGLSSLALLTGNLGRPAVGVGPARTK